MKEINKIKNLRVLYQQQQQKNEQNKGGQKKKCPVLHCPKNLRAASRLQQ